MDQSGSSCLRLIPSALFPMTQLMPWSNSFTGIGIALSFRPYVHPFRLWHVSIACLLWNICQNFSLQWRQMSIKPYQFVCFPSVSSAICLGWLQRRHQISASLALCAGNHWWPMNFPHNGPILREAFLCNAVIPRRLPPILNPVQDQNRIQLISIWKR